MCLCLGINDLLYMVWSCLEKEFYGFNHLDAVENFVCLRDKFGMMTNKQPTKPKASLLFTSEEAVFCNGWFVVARMTTMVVMMFILTFSENNPCR